MNNNGIPDECGNGLSIILQPESVSTCTGTTAEFMALPVGQPPFDYQWSFNGVDIAGANSNTYSIASVQAIDFGDYELTITDFQNVVISNVASLTDFGSVATTSEPSSTTLFEGLPASLQVIATGGGTLRYQWHFEGQELVGATGLQLVIPSVKQSDNGS